MTKGPLRKYVDSFLPKLANFRRSRFLPFGILGDGETIWLFAFDKKDKNLLYRLPSDEHFSFSKKGMLKVEFELDEKFKPLLSGAKNVHFFKSAQEFQLNFSLKVDELNLFFHGSSPDMNSWVFKLATPMVAGIGVVVSDYKYKDQHFGFFGEDNIGLSVSKDLDNWEAIEPRLFSLREGYFDSESIKPLGAREVRDGILLIYDSSSLSGKEMHSKLGALILDKKNPTHILWRCQSPIWEERIKVNSRYGLGVVFLGEHILAYYSDGASRNLSAVKLLAPFSQRKASPFAKKKVSTLKRKANNPILSPKEINSWEAEATFNPAVWDDGEKVHMLYRAIGKDGVSRIGYSCSPDGVDFRERLASPALELNSPKGKKMVYSKELYPSGGSWGGAEDPRMVEIDGRVYLTMSCFDNWNYIRMAAVSISAKDFRERNFKWGSPVFLSPEGEVHKNWVLFPEKINGKFAILHNLSPQVSIDYVDSLEDLHEGKKVIKSVFNPRAGEGCEWEDRMRGVGPPPLKTSKGWLVFYHAMDRNEPNRYKLGVMLLDLKDPSKVLHRAKNPILEPDMNYENDGKPGVIYICSAIIKGDELFVYYGGADKVVCAASADLKTFLNELIANKNPFLSTKAVSIS